MMDAEDVEDQATMDAIEKHFIGHGVISPCEVRFIIRGCGGSAGGSPDYEAMKAWASPDAAPPITQGVRMSGVMHESVGIVTLIEHKPRPVPFPARALRHQQQRIGLFVPR